jgi:hypothetical protein
MNVIARCYAAISANEIAEWELRNWFSVVRAVTIAMQQLSKRTLNNGKTLFRGVCAERLS